MKIEKILEVYKITNKLNNKIYVGITNQGYKRRWHKHCSDSYRRSYSPLHLSMTKHGIENFKIELIEVCKTVEELKEREIFWIKELDSYNKKVGYNATLGGDGTFGKLASQETKQLMSLKAKERAGKVLTYIEKTDEIKEFASIREAAIYLKVSEPGLRDRIRRGIFVKGTYSTLIKVKGSSKQNRRPRAGFTQTEETKRKITETNKNRWTAEMKKQKRETSATNKKVLQYTLDNIFIKEHISASSAARELNIQRENISKCLRGLRKKSGNYIWKYKSSN